MSTPVRPLTLSDDAGDDPEPLGEPMQTKPSGARRDEHVMDDRWVLPEVNWPELLVERLRQVVLAWVDRASHVVRLGRNMAVRWDREHPEFWFDRDLYVVEPASEGAHVLSLRVWQPDPLVPSSVEIAGPGGPDKHSLVLPAKYYAARDVREVWVLDTTLFGPKVEGRPHRIQIWRRLEDDRFERVVAAAGRVWSETVQRWVHATGHATGEDGSFQVCICAGDASREPQLTASDAVLRRAEAACMAREAAQRQVEMAERQVDILARQTVAAQRDVAAERILKEAAQREAEAERTLKEAAQREAEAALREIATLKAQLAGGR